MYPEFLKYIEQQLAIAHNKAVAVQHYTSVSGGSINDAYCLHTSAGKFMLKVNNRVDYPNMFRLEAEGLTAIKGTHTIATPSPFLFGDFKQDSFLVLEWIETSRATAANAVALGQQLAAMHRHTAAQFGLSYNNYMGSLPQSNYQHSSWSEFFIRERLQPMVQLAQHKQLLTAADVSKFEKLYDRLPNLFQEEAPALIHGDLWGGNYLISSNGMPYLIDPAVSYGNREFDIAMTTLFGGFNPEFYEAYQEAFPLCKGWQQRLNLWNLYPLLLHLNLFGNSYLGQVRSALQPYS